MYAHRSTQKYTKYPGQCTLEEWDTQISILYLFNNLFNISVISFEKVRIAMKIRNLLFDKILNYETTSF